MQFKIFTISVFEASGSTDEMNRFLRSNKVVNVEKQLITLPEGVFWTFCVHYIGMEAPAGASFERKEKVDYKEVLDEAAFGVFSKLRAVRKKIATDDAVPAYAVFTDAELAEVARLSEITPQTMRAVHGIGDKKVEKYGKMLCELFSEETAIEKEEK